MGCECYLRLKCGQRPCFRQIHTNIIFSQLCKLVCVHYSAFYPNASPFVNESNPFLAQRLKIPLGCLKVALTTTVYNPTHVMLIVILIEFEGSKNAYASQPHFSH